MNERTKHIAARVDVGRELRFCPQDNPDSLCPGEWARAFISSADKKELAVLRWFTNAMHTARHGVYPPDQLEDGE